MPADEPLQINARLSSEVEVIGFLERYKAAGSDGMSPSLKKNSDEVSTSECAVLRAGSG